MTVDAIPPRAVYTYTQDVKYPVPFAYIDKTSVYITLVDAATQKETNLQQGLDWRFVVGNPTLVELITIPTAPCDVVVFRASRQTQETDWQANVEISPDILEFDFDKAILLIQEIYDELQNVMRLPVNQIDPSVPIDPNVLNRVLAAVEECEAILAQVTLLAAEALANAEAAEAAALAADGSAAAAAESEEAVTLDANKAELAAANARADADRAAALVDPATLASGVYNVRKALITTQAVSSGGIVTLPGYYFPTRGVLYLTYQGVTCTPRLSGVDASGQYQYEEVGTDPDVPSNQIKVCFDVAVGEVFDMWVVSSAAGQNVEEIEAMVALAQSAAADAEEAADKAETAAGKIPDVATALDGQTLVARNVGGTMVAEYENPPSPTVAEQRAVLASTLAAGTNYTVPTYIVGSNKLTVSCNGLHYTRGTDSAVAQYQEVGVTGAASTVIKFFDAQPAGTQITVSAAG